MKTAYRPNAYWLRGALPTVEQSRDDYIGSVYGALPPWPTCPSCTPQRLSTCSRNACPATMMK